MNRTITATGAIFIVIGIILGAFGAHALKERLDAEQLLSFETGVRYLIYHGIALLILGLSADKILGLTWPFRLLVTGTILFSGSIFLLAMQGIMGITLKFLGPVTPIGGVLMITGWAILIKNLLLQKK